MGIFYTNTTQWFSIICFSHLVFLVSLKKKNMDYIIGIFGIIIFIVIVNKLVNSQLKSNTTQNKPTSEPTTQKGYGETSAFASDNFRDNVDGLSNRKIDSELLKPRKDLEDTSHFFYGKKVVITGKYEQYLSRNTMAKLLWEVGADIDTTVTKNTDIMIIGFSGVGPKKMEKAIEHGVQIMRETEFLQHFPNTGYKSRLKK